MCWQHWAVSSKPPSDAITTPSDKLSLVRLYQKYILKCRKHWKFCVDNFKKHINLKMSDEKKGESEHINLKVLGQDNAIVQFKIKKHTPLRKLMNAYCDRAGLSMQVVRFRFDGQPINENDTPTSLEMEEGDTIEVYQQQTGGVSLV
ncbi:small ubiquitin-related modifier 3 [Manduca sexta]|nr:small ubiquitin-related modifier 3 [Manduca sexta]